MGSPPAGSGSDQMNIHEYQAKILLSEFGVPISAGKPVLNPSEAEAAAKALPAFANAAPEKQPDAE